MAADSVTHHVTFPTTSTGLGGLFNPLLNDTHEPDTDIGSSTRIMAYVYGTISVSIVSLLSLTGAAFLPIMSHKLIYRCALITFMAMGAGTMITDAFLHMIPECLGVHSHFSSDDDHGHGHGHEHGHGHGHGHSHDDHDHDHKSPDAHADHGHNDTGYLSYMIAMVASVYALYMLETISIVAARYFKFASSHGAHTHFGHHGMHTTLSNGTHQEMSESKISTKNGSHGAVVGNESQKSSASLNHWSQVDEDQHSQRSVDLICGLKPVAFMIIFGDGLHNFCDGLAIGAAFTQNGPAGVATSVAVLCHELPHEIGDFAILLNSNMSVKKALCFNFLSALTAFLGLYIGIEAGQLENMRGWIFALVAGGFLYIAMVHMLNEIKECSEHMQWGLAFVLQNFGFVTGFVVIWILAYYE